ncbi:tigger transposable element-derived protein 1-like [Centruroides sculpturatus]|uniref:tigger transposable element-derived protein 1-like n=1 Tax=Centruroides sculpturatus TaxID=218467 RepID=UPI000C6CADC0|nr:tigger transposable element-derived protein 1-like [Centruroides sculpturatus]
MVIEVTVKPLLVYCSENPRTLKNKSKSDLPVIWKSNRKAWVAASLFEDWFGHHLIPEVERSCQSKQIPFKVMLIIDNAPCHTLATLTNFDPRVKVVFLPPSTTSLLQLMDQGVIKTFKAYYTRRSFAHLHGAMRQNNELSVKDFWKQFNVLDAAESVLETDEIGNVIEEVIDFARQINLEVDSDDVRELLDSHNQELTIDEVIEMREQEQDIEELDSLD